MTVQDGLPLQFPGSEGVGVRVLHPTNPKAPSKNFGLTMYYLPPHVTSETASHYTEECYLVLRGSGDMILAGRRVPVKPGCSSTFPPGASTPWTTPARKPWKSWSAPRRPILERFSPG